MKAEVPPRANEALDTILELRALWRRSGGRLTLADLGIQTRLSLRSRGNAALPPERWRAYPGAKSAHHEWVTDL